MNEHSSAESGNGDEIATGPSQVELYDDLRRIGQLEDQKQSIQREINERTERLRVGMKSLDPDSLLRQMLVAGLGGSRLSKPASTRKKASAARKSTATARRARKKKSARRSK